MVNWIDDVHAEKTLNDLQIAYEKQVISINAINKKESLKNTARLDINLDEDNVDSITRGASSGDPIPKIVVRRVATKNHLAYVVAGGNHRLEAMIRLGEQLIECYVVEVGESEFMVLCQMLNLQNGKSVTRQNRVLFAMDAFDKGIYKTKKEAAAAFRIDPNTLSHSFNDRKAQQKLASRAPTSYKPPMVVIRALEKVQFDDVHKVAFDFAESSKKMKQEDVAEIIRSALEKPSVKEQIETLENAKTLMPERAIASPDRQAFLKALTKLDSILDKHKTLASLDIVSDKEKVKERIDSVVRRIKSL